jgi:uncharacterized protein (DUF1499 family)
MIGSRTLAAAALLLLMCAALSSCRGGKSPAAPGLRDARLAPCPASPNCVSSDAADGEHRIAPLQLAATPDEAWQAVRQLVAELPRTQVISETPDYLHAECRTLLGFVDDLEVQLRPAENIIAVRSASRLGYSDLGVNRKRVENLRAALIRRGMVR